MIDSSYRGGPLLEMEKVSVYRSDRLVFDRVSLSLSYGEQTAILGPNGSGKSTLLKLLSGEVHPVPDESSTFRLCGLERWSVWEIRAALGIVSHDLHRDYDGMATGLEVLLSGFYSSVGVYPHQRFDEGQHYRARDVAELVGMAPLLDRPYVQLSTGEQRRCLLGRALVHRPRVLVLDEPTSGLDPQACAVYLSIVRRLMAGGTTVVIVTHHVHEIPPEVTRVILLKEGRVWRDGARAEMLTGQNLSRLYGISLTVLSGAGGFVHAVPADSASRTETRLPGSGRSC